MSIQLTPQQKQEYYDSKVQRYKEMVLLAEQETGMCATPILKAGMNGIVPVLAIVPLDKTKFEEGVKDKELEGSTGKKSKKHV